MLRQILALSLFLLPASLDAASIPLTVRNRLNQPRPQVPVTWSVPLGLEQNTRDAARLRLVRAGVEVPAQFTPLARWGGRVDQTDRPISWVLVDTRVDLNPGETLALVMEEVPPATVASPLRVVRDDVDSIVISTGTATYTLSKRAFHLFDAVVLATGETFAPNAGFSYNSRIIDSPCSLAVEHIGRERISLVGRGTLQGAMDYTIRLQFYRALSEVRVELRLENFSQFIYDTQPRANDYGSQGSVAFDDLSMIVTTRGNAYEMPAGELGSGGTLRGAVTGQLALVQESSGDPNWDAMRELAPRLQSGVTKRASTVRMNNVATDGPNQIAGWLDAGGVTVAVERAWQNFPKAFRATPEQVEIGLFPGEYSRDHELRPSEFKTHTFWIRHHGSGASDVASRAQSFLSPVRLIASPEHVSRTLAVGLMAPRMEQSFPEYESGVDYQITESPEWRTSEYQARTVFDAISISQSYGWVDYGDIPTDFEVMTSPYNMKYDALRGLLMQALRSDDADWWELGSAAAHHVGDIDVHHSRLRGHTTPRVWFEGGIYGHGYHYEDSRLNPHRNYMNPSSSMAGPSAGLFLWALIAGDTLLLESARETADNLYWRTTNTNYDESVAGASTCALNAGLQLCGADCRGYEAADFSRAGGNVAQAMISAYQATGEPDYLDLVGRLANYVECLESTILSPTCNRFHFQTTFVRSIGHYLILRDKLTMPEDLPAKNLLRRRMDYMTDVLWNPATQQFRMCYYDDVLDTTLTPIEDNWLLSVADSFAVGSTVLHRPELLNVYGQVAFRYGSANQFYAGSANSYHSAKEFVNQVGFGQMFLATWWQSTTVPRRRSARH